MVMLEAAMAFAVAMIIFSTITTGIVEMIHRISKMRSKTLKIMAHQLFEDFIWPRLQQNLTAQDKTKAMCKFRDKFVEDMTHNPMANATGKKTKFTKEIEVLTPLSFAERLARTDVGKAMMAEGDRHLEVMITDFSRSFDRLGKAASEFVGSRARTLSVLVAVALALGANIDAGRLITTLVENPKLRTGLIEKADAAAKENREAVNYLKGVLENAEAGKLKPPGVSDIQIVLKTLDKKIDLLETEGLPIGFEYFPYCKDNNFDSVCRRIFEKKSPAGTPWSELYSNSEYRFAYLRWLIMCIVSGLLIGLGGPFWYQAFLRLSQVMQLVRAVGIGGKKADKKAPPEPPAPENSTKPESVIDAFKVAAEIYNHPQTQNPPNADGVPG